MTAAQDRLLLKSSLFLLLLGALAQAAPVVKVVGDPVRDSSSMLLAADREGNAFTLIVGRFDRLLEKRDSSGALLWSNSISVQARSLVVDARGDAYVAGTDISNATAFVVRKFLRDGSAGYTKTIPYPVGLFPSASLSLLTVTNDGEAVICGVSPTYASFPVAMNPRPAAFGGNYCAKLDHDGNDFVYARAVRGTITSAAADRDGSVILGGTSFVLEPGAPGIQRERPDRTFFMSNDGGQTWSSPGSAALAIAADPFEPSHILRNTTEGTFESWDAGASWSPVYGLPASYMPALFFHPTKQGLIFAGRNTVPVGLWRSDDNGTSWQQIEGMEVQGFAAGRGDAIVAWQNSSLYVSRDLGRNWRLTWLLFSQGGIASVIVDPADSDHMLVSTTGSSSNVGTFETRDASRFNFLSGISAVALAFDPANVGVIYGYGYNLNASPAGYAAATAGNFSFPNVFVRSDDGGKTWRMPASGQSVPTRRVIVDPRTPGRLYAFGGLGIWLSEDAGEHWTRVAESIGNVNIADTAVAFGSPDTLYARADAGGDGYLLKLDPAGQTVFETFVGGSARDEVTSVAIAANGDILAAGTTQSNDLLASVGASVVANTFGFSDGFVVRLSSDGTQLQGVLHVGNESAESLSSITELPDGSIAAAGSSIDSDRSKPGLFATATADVSAVSELARTGEPVLRMTYAYDWAAWALIRLTANFETALAKIEFPH